MISRRRPGPAASGAVLAGRPAGGFEVSPRHCGSRRFKRSVHRIVPAVQKTEQRDHAGDVDNLAVVPVRALRRLDRRGDGIRDAGGRYRVLERRTFGRAVKATRAELPQPRQLPDARPA